MGKKDTVEEIKNALRVLNKYGMEGFLNYSNEGEIVLAINIDTDEAIGLLEEYGNNEAAEMVEEKGGLLLWVNS